MMLGSNLESNAGNVKIPMYLSRPEFSPGNLFFLSAGVGDPTGEKLMKEAWYGVPLQTKKILLVNTKRFGISDFISSFFYKQGFSTDGVLFSEDGEPDTRVDFIYVPGGNTFDTLHHIRKQKLVLYIKEAVKRGSCYIGVSAGAVVAGLDICVAEGKDRNEENVTDLNGLALFAGSILPHYEKEYLKNYIRNSGEKYKNKQKNHLFSVAEDEILIFQFCSTRKEYSVFRHKSLSSSL